MTYKIEITEDAKVDLSFFRPYERKIILTNIKKQLSYEPLTETKNRRNLRDNPIAPWELRSGKYRIFYDVVNENFMVGVIAIGIKEHNILYIRGEVVKI